MLLSSRTSLAFVFLRNVRSCRRAGTSSLLWRSSMRNCKLQQTTSSLCNNCTTCFLLKQAPCPDFIQISLITSASLLLRSCRRTSTPLSLWRISTPICWRQQTTSFWCTKTRALSTGNGPRTARGSAHPRCIARFWSTGNGRGTPARTARMSGRLATR
jgi:hypothetical protein